jgi:hypothetical protein
MVAGNVFNTAIAFGIERVGVQNVINSETWKYPFIGGFKAFTSGDESVV